MHSTDAKSRSTQDAKRRAQARRNLKRAPISPALCKTLDHLLDRCNKFCRYELSWTSQGRMAEETRQSSRTIKRHLKAIAMVGAVRIIPMTTGEATAYCLVKYDYVLKLQHLHNALNFYQIVWRHPIWKGRLSEDDQASVRKALEGPRKKQVMDNLDVTHHPTNGDGGVTINSDGGVPRKGKKELPSDSGVSSLFPSKPGPPEPPLAITDRTDPRYHCCTSPSCIPMISSDQVGRKGRGYDLMKIRRRIGEKLDRIYEQSAPLRFAACSGSFDCSSLASLAPNIDSPRL